MLGTESTVRQCQNIWHAADSKLYECRALCDGCWKQSSVDLGMGSHSIRVCEQYKRPSVCRNRYRFYTPELFMRKAVRHIRRRSTVRTRTSWSGHSRREHLHNRGCSTNILTLHGLVWEAAQVWLAWWKNQTFQIFCANSVEGGVCVALCKKFSRISAVAQKSSGPLREPTTTAIPARTS
jgi:hypothetical protein